MNAMSPTSLRAKLLLLGLAGPLLLVACVGLAGWLGAPMLVEAIDWRLLLSLLAAVCIPALLAWILAQRNLLDARRSALGAAKDAALAFGDLELSVGLPLEVARSP